LEIEARVYGVRWKKRREMKGSEFGKGKGNDLVAFTDVCLFQAFSVTNES
jgi:hypothetical protein